MIGIQSVSEQIRQTLGAHFSYESRRVGNNKYFLGFLLISCEHSLRRREKKFGKPLEGITIIFKIVQWRRLTDLSLTAPTPLGKYAHISVENFDCVRYFVLQKGSVAPLLPLQMFSRKILFSTKNHGTFSRSLRF